jgi:MFS family permease
MIVARTLAATGTGMLPVALSFTVLENLHSTEDLGLVLGAESVAVVASIFFAGIIGDRFSRKKIVLSSDTTIAFARIVMAVGAIVHVVPLMLFLGAEIVAGVAKAIFFPSFEGWFKSAIPAHLRQQATSLRSVYWNLGNIIGPAIAGAIAAWSRPAFALLISGILPLGAAVIFRTVGAGTYEPPSNRGRVVDEIKEGFAAFRALKWIWVLDIQSALWFIAVWAPLIVLGPIVALHRYHGASSWALVWSTFSVGGIAGGILVYRSRARFPLRTGVLAMIPTGAILVALATHSSILVLCGTALIAGVGIEYFSATYGVLMQTHVPHEVMSKVSSFDVLGATGLTPLGYALAVPASHLFGTDGVFLIGVGYLVLSSLIVLLVRSVRDLKRIEVTAATS